ncbi:MAG: pectate lyase, partial [Oscillospiraceae bacterium]|nr:pectate lyase [Oscillospiraceae bacterium]
MQIIQTLRRTASAVLGVLISCTMLPVLPQSVSAATTITVGSGGTYRTVTEAVNAAAAMKPSSEADRITIAIAPGTYREQIIINTPYLSFVNSNPSGGEVLLTWYYGIGYQYYSCDNNGYYNAANAAAKSSKGKPARWGTAVRINSGAKYFRAENITFENSFNRYLTNEEIADGVSISGESSITYQRYHGVEVRSKAATERAAACCVEAAYSEFYNCNFYSSQDTLYTSAAAYFKDCKIEGNTDYIFGSGDIVFDECELSFGGYSDKAVGGYITAAREQSLGYLFWNCTVTANPNLIASSGYFGRPWRDTAHVLFYNTKLQYESIITPVGWTSMSGVDPSQATFREFGTTTMNGGGVNTGSRTPGTVLYSCNATRETYLNGWTPYYFNMTTPPVVINGNLLSEVTVNDRANAAKWIMADHLSVGSNAFGDRDFTYISVPEALQGAEFIQTACDSKYYTSDLAEITVKEPIKLYVALDTRLSPVPAWIGERGFTQTDMTLAISNDVSFHVYQKAV